MSYIFILHDPNSSFTEREYICFNKLYDTAIFCSQKDTKEQKVDKRLCNQIDGKDFVIYKWQ